MNCTQANCHHPALFQCDGCGEERCVNHAKACEECGKTFCQSHDSLCHAAHECNPATRDTFTEEMIRLTDRSLGGHIVRLN